MISFYSKFSSPLKIILSGEHSVVYSKNAIAAAINLRYSCQVHEIIQENPNSKFFFNENLIFSIETNKLLKDVYDLYDFYGTNLLKYSFFKDIPLNFKESIEKDLYFVYFSIFIECFINKSKEQLCKYYTKKGFDVRISTKVPDLTGIGSSASYLSCLTASLYVFIKNMIFR